MNVTKYPQSCMLIEKDNTRVVIDPGEPFMAEFDIEDLGQLDAVLFTHKHSDHLADSVVEYLVENKIPMYGNDSVVEHVGEGIELVESEDEFIIGALTVQAFDLPHCLMPDGSPGPPNTGFLIDDNFFHPGDGVEIEGLQSDVVAAPIAGPDVSPKDTFSLAKAVAAQRIIPIHYDVFIADPHVLSRFSEKLNLGFEFIILDHGESVELQ